MKRRLSLACAVTVSILLFAAVARNASDDRRDGTWWRELTRVQKTNYMVGFFDGMKLGNSFSYWGILDKDKNDAAIGKVTGSYDDYDQKYFGHVTNLQLVDGLDTFYSDYRNRVIQVPGAVWLVVNEISGKSDAEMEKMIESWRQGAAASQQ
jgi:hypothetical protein